MLTLNTQELDQLAPLEDWVQSRAAEHWLRQADAQSQAVAAWITIQGKNNPTYPWVGWRCTCSSEEEGCSHIELAAARRRRQVMELLQEKFATEDDRLFGLSLWLHSGELLVPVVRFLLARVLENECMGQWSAGRLFVSDLQNILTRQDNGASEKALQEALDLLKGSREIMVEGLWIRPYSDYEEERVAWEVETGHRDFVPANVFSETWYCKVCKKQGDYHPGQLPLDLTCNPL